MHSYFILKTVHVLGVIMLFTSLSVILAECSDRCRKRATIMHGVALLILLLVGFAILKKPPMGQYWWVAKLVIWLLLGAVPTLAKRNVLPRPALLFGSIGCGAGVPITVRIDEFEFELDLDEVSALLSEELASTGVLPPGVAQLPSV